MLKSYWWGGGLLFDLGACWDQDLDQGLTINARMQDFLWTLQVVTLSSQYVWCMSVRLILSSAEQDSGTLRVVGLALAPSLRKRRPSESEPTYYVVNSYN